MCNDTLIDFKKGTTQSFKVFPKKNGIVQEATPTVSIKITNGTNTLEKDASDYPADGSAFFILEASETGLLPAGSYDYEIKWVSGTTEVVMQTSTINIEERV